MHSFFNLFMDRLRKFCSAGMIGLIIPGLSVPVIAGLSVLMIAGIMPATAYSQENDRAELLYTQRLSKQFPDSAFLLLKEMYSQALSRKDRLGTGICLQQMGQICYYLGNYPKALDFHEQADKLFRAEGDKERLAANLNDMGLLYYYNRQMPLARKQYDEALSIYSQKGN